MPESVTVNVTGCPGSDNAFEDERFAVVPAWTTVCVSDADTGKLKLSPE